MNFPIPNNYTLKEISNSKGLIVFVHGLTSSQDEEIFVKGEKFFKQNGFSTLRFNLYGEEIGERKLTEICLQDNIDDVNSVLIFCKNLGYKNIFLIGHSYGCIANLYVNHENISGILMWDPSIGGPRLSQSVFKDGKGGYFIDWGDLFKHIISKKLYNDFLIPSEKYLEKISKINIPTLIIGAEKGLADNAKNYYEFANLPKEFKIISGADHRFMEGGMEELFQKSIDWVERFSV